MRVNFFAATCAVLFELGLTSAVYNTGSSNLAQMQDLESMQMAQTWTALDLEATPAENKAKASADKEKAKAKTAQAEAQKEKAKAKTSQA